MREGRSRSWYIQTREIRQRPGVKMRITDGDGNELPRPGFARPVTGAGEAVILERGKREPPERDRA